MFKSWIGVRKLATVVVFLVTIFFIPASEKIRSAQGALAGPELPYKSGTVLVRFNQQVGWNTIDNVMHNVHAVQTGIVFGSDVIILEVTPGEENEIISRLSEHPDVLFAEPDYLHAITTLPEDPYYGAQWALTSLRANQAWDITTGETVIKIAIIDTGIDKSHPDLISKILPGQSFLNQGQQDNNPVDLHGHGTHVAGIAAAETNNNAGVAGMSWGARIIPVRVLDHTGEGLTSDIAAGINWARVQGADIINLSLGGEADSVTMKTAIQEAYNAGILVVASMGNDKPGITFYPAAYPHVLAVAATDHNNQRAPYSNYGMHTDIAAPGGYMTGLHDSNGILSTLPTYAVYLTTEWGYSTYYDTLHGTSQAAAFISGLAALIWSVDSALSPDDVSNVITSTAVDLGDPGWDQYYGHGLADARAALDSINLLENAPVLHEIGNADQDGNYVVQWEIVERATSYYLEMSTDSGFVSPTLIYSGAATEFHVAGQPAGRWYYRVKASNASGDSPWSFAVQTGVLPDPPVLLPISSSGPADAYTLSWSSVPGAKGYVLEQAENITFTQPVTRYKGVDLQHYISGQSGGEWFYRVHAYNNVGSGAWSNTQSITVPTTTLDAPELLPIDNGDGDSEYSVFWSAVPSTTIYALEVSGSPYFHTRSLVYAGSLTTQSITNQAKGTWYYRVRGYNATTYSPWSAIQKTVVVSYIYVPLMLRQYTAPMPSSYLANGDFEAGHTGWLQYSLGGYPLIVNKAFSGMKEPHGGDWAVWMGGDYGEIAYIQQEVFIYTSAPNLTYWHWIESEETDCGVDNVTLIVNIDVVKVYDLCVTQNTGGWVQRSVDLSAYTGGKATLVMRVGTNYQLNSNYYIDDLAFSASPVSLMSPSQPDDLLIIPLMKP